VFRPLLGNEFILGAVGALQFDVIKDRMAAEYGVDAIYEPVNYDTARWISCLDPKRLGEFEKAHRDNLALDAEGNLTYLLSSVWLLQRLSEQWPEVTFLKTREHD